MLKKKLGINAIERNYFHFNACSDDFFKIPFKLSIPESCEKIGYAAFWYCKELREVIIPESVEEIGDKAFCGCYNATVILKKPEHKFEFIGENALDDCKDVKEEVRN